MVLRALALSLILPLAGAPSYAADPEHLSQVLLQRRCEACDLRSADLVHADLAGARLRQAQLQTAN